MTVLKLCSKETGVYILVVIQLYLSPRVHHSEDKAIMAVEAIKAVEALKVAWLLGHMCLP